VDTDVHVTQVTSITSGVINESGPRTCCFHEDELFTPVDELLLTRMQIKLLVTSTCNLKQIFRGHDT